MCFPFGSIENFLIWLVVVIAAVAIVQVLIRMAAVPSWVLEILRIVMWAVIAIAVISLLFGLLYCVWPLRLR